MQEKKTQTFKILSCKEIMSTPQNKESSLNPLGDAKFPEDNWFQFYVEANKKEKIKLHTYRYSPEGDIGIEGIRAVVVLFHGMNNHLNNCAHVAKAISQLKIAVVGFDHRGFGLSQGQPGLVESEEQHLQDSEKFIEHVEKTYPGKKIFLGGQSMGGMTSFLLSVKYPNRFAGNLLFAPAIKDQSSNQKIGKFFAKCLGAVAPKIKTVPQSFGDSNKNPEIDRFHQKDSRMYLGKVIPGTVRFLLNGMDKCHKMFEKYNVSFLLVQGGIDKFVCPTIANELPQRSPAQDKEVLFYPNGWHSLWLEEEINDIIPKVCDWLEKRI